MSESSQTTNNELHIAYGCFIEQVKTISQSEHNYTYIFRMLNITRVELVFIESLHRYEQGKKALKFAYLRKAISFLESEIDLLKLIFLQANRFSVNSQSRTSKVYFIPKPKEGLGIDSMGEFATTFELSSQFVDEEGKPAPFIHIAHSLENAFNFSFGDAYKSKSRIFNRKPYNLTKALDYLKNLIIKASRKTR